MHNRLYVIIIGFSILTAFIGLLTNSFASASNIIALGESMIKFGIGIGSLTSLGLLASNGTFLSSKYFKIAQNIMFAIVVASVLKLMGFSIHFKIFGPIILIAVLIIYFIHFLKKPNKIRLVYLKVFFVSYCYVLSTFEFSNLVNQSIILEYSWFGTLLLWLAVIDFSVKGLKNGTLFILSDSEDYDDPYKPINEQKWHPAKAGLPLLYASITLQFG